MLDSNQYDYMAEEPAIMRELLSFCYRLCIMCAEVKNLKHWLAE